MPLFGAHMSIAVGLRKAVGAAQAHGCGTLQIFIAAPQQWPVRPLSAAGTGFQPGNF
jgi:deoxyribonuclease IV